MRPESSGHAAGTEESAALLLAYLRGVVDRSRALFGRLPIPPKVQSIATTFTTLAPAIDALRVEEVEALKALDRPRHAPLGDDGRPAAMNTVGILADRLTILLCKEWYLRHRQKNEAASREVGEQIDDIMRAFLYVTPGRATLLDKVSTLPADARATSFEEAYYGILEANLLMWETQEVLYMSDMKTVPDSELRDYVNFFSIANLKRNLYIKFCETLFWVDGPGA